MSKFNRRSYDSYEKPRYNSLTNKRRSANINVRQIQKYDDIYAVGDEVNKIIKITCKASDTDCWKDLVSELQSIIIKFGGSKCELKPINPYYNNGIMEFYVSVNRQNARVLLRTYKKSRFNVRCMEFSEYHVPAEFPNHWIDLVKETLKSRYLSSGQGFILDLSNFSDDKYLNENGLKLKMSVSKVMENIVNIVKPALTSLSVLNLSKNQLQNIYKLKSLLSSVTIQKLDLSNNRIKDISDLLILRGSSIQELDISENEISNTLKLSKLKDAIRDYIPNLRILNGKELEEPVIIAGGSKSVVKTASSKSLPPTIKSQDRNSDLFQFLRNYFSKFDMKNRDLICDCYSSDSCLTLATYGDVPLVYKSNSMNFQLLRQAEKRKTNRRIGKVQVMGLLADFPNTLHLIESEAFNMDIIASGEKFVTVRICGVFIEFPPSGKQSGAYRPREFGRFMTIYEGGIILQDHIDIMPNDHQLYLRYKEKIDEIRKADEFVRKHPVLEKSMSNSGGSGYYEEVGVVQRFYSYSGLKVSAVLQLLQSCSSYEEACTKFTEMKAANQIPQDMFDKL